MSAVYNLARERLLAFAMLAFKYLYKGKSLTVFPFVELLCFRLERVLYRAGARRIFCLPPRHLKTFLSAICLPAWILGHRPSAKILIISSNQDLA